MDNIATMPAQDRSDLFRAISVVMCLILISCWRPLPAIEKGLGAG